MTPQQAHELAGDEGTRLAVYDDATGRPIVPGSVVVGHPTIGTGRALDVHGISDGESLILFDNDIAAVEAAMAGEPWFVALDPVRQGVMINLAFNMGVRGLDTFTHMMADIVRGEHDLSAAFASVAAGDFASAAAELANSKWAQQVQPSRRDRLLAQLASGTVGTA